MALTTEQGVQLDRHLRSRLCGALASFQGSDDADEAALVQMWLSKTDDNGVVLLSTKVRIGLTIGWTPHTVEPYTPEPATPPPPPQQMLHTDTTLVLPAPRLT